MIGHNLEFLLPPRRPFRDSRGFSLVELMVVVGIIAILASIGVPKFQIFKIKAYQAEAKSNLNSLYGLMVAYQADTGSYPDHGAPGVSKVGDYGLLVGDSANSCLTTGCNCVNSLGFNLPNCTKARYMYWFVRHSLLFPDPGFIVYAIASTVNPAWGCSGGNELSDRWSMNTTKTLCNYIPATKISGFCGPSANFGSYYATAGCQLSYFGSTSSDTP
jgi:prepilin-type N-terminal cleavage/methylation domain-containing protein